MEVDVLLTLRPLTASEEVKGCLLILLCLENSCFSVFIAIIREFWMVDNLGLKNK